MQAIGIKHYGDANTLVSLNLPKPIPTDDQVLIQINAASVNPIDWKLRCGMLKLIIKPKFPAILGFDLSGKIIAVGNNIKNFSVGDEVYACSNYPTGQSYAEYIALTTDVIAHKPAQLSHREAATIPLAGITAYQALHKLGRIKANDKVLIIGASGGVGMFAMQIAKACGAKVTAVCGKHSVDFVNAFKPDKIINYEQQNPLSGDEKYQIIFDAVSQHSYTTAKPLLATSGIYIATLPTLSLLLQKIVNLFRKKKAYFIMLKSNAADLNQLSQLIKTQQLTTHISHTFKLNDMALAHQQSETGHTQGKIAIDIHCN